LSETKFDNDFGILKLKNEKSRAFNKDSVVQKLHTFGFCLVNFMNPEIISKNNDGDKIRVADIFIFCD